MENNIITTRATKFPSHVYGKNANSCLVHRVREVLLMWRLNRRGERVFSHTAIHTECSQIFFPRRATMCEIPKAEAVDCGRCLHRGSVFKWHGDYPKRKEAHGKLGCAVDR